LHGSRPETVVWSAGNFDVLACIFAFAATLCALRRSLVGACAFTALALLSKESAYSTPLLIFGLAYAAGRTRELLRPILGSFAVAAVMFVWRWTMFHGPGGYIDPATGQAQVLSFHFGSALKALLLRVWALMLFPVNWEAFTSSIWIAIAIGVAAWALLSAPSPARRISVALLATTVATLMPAYHLALHLMRASGALASRDCHRDGAGEHHHASRQSKCMA
jgi:hypothetical protein